jgi:hypothetical protein
MRQRLFPLTAGDRQLVPFLVFAPHRGLISIGVVLRLWLLTIPARRTDRVPPLFSSGRLCVVGLSHSTGLLVASVCLNSANDCLPARFDVDLPDAHIARAVAPKALERINELRYDCCTLEGVSEIDITVLDLVKRNSCSQRKAIVSGVGDANDQASQHRLESILRL